MDKRYFGMSSQPFNAAGVIALIHWQRDDITGTLSPVVAGDSVLIPWPGIFEVGNGGMGDIGPRATTGATPGAALEVHGGESVNAVAGNLNLRGGYSGGAALDGIVDSINVHHLRHVHLRPETPAQITSDQHNYALPVSGVVIRFSTDAPRTITGFSTGIVTVSYVYRLLLIFNVGANNLVLANENAGSFAQNRIITGTGGDVTLAANQSCWLWYDLTTLRWRMRQ